jgi:hypothetical protein
MMSSMPLIFLSSTGNTIKTAALPDHGNDFLLLHRAGASSGGRGQLLIVDPGGSGVSKDP